jgi:hypothetical protein
MNPQLLGWLAIVAVFVAFVSFALGMQYAADRILRRRR